MLDWAARFDKFVETKKVRGLKVLLVELFLSDKKHGDD